MPKAVSGYFCQFQTATRFGFAHIMEAKFFFAALVLSALSPISGFNQGKVNSFNLFSPKFGELYRIWYVFIHIKTSDVLEQI